FPYEQAAAFPAAAGSALTFLIPYWNGDPATDTFRGSGLFWEQYGYVGLLPFLLAIAAVVVRRRDPVVRFLAGGAVVAHLLALGGNTPVFAIAFHAIPGMSHFRFPTRFLVFVELALALLAGLGLDLVAERLRARNLAGAAVAFVLGITAADLWAHQMRQVPQADWSAWTAPTGTERFLEQRRAEASEPWRYHSLDAQWVHAQTFHAAHGWAGDLAPYVWLRALLQPSFNLLGELESADGYANLVPRHYESVWGSEKEPGLVIPSGRSEGGEWRLRPEVLKCLRLFNVRYVLAPWPVSSPGIAPATRSAEGIHVHEVLDPLPRAFVVGGTRRAADAGEALRLLVAPDFDPAAEAIVTDDVALPPGSGASRSVSFARPSTTSVELRAVLDRPGLLVVSEGTHPGWRATVDGIAAPILRVNVMMRGVVLTAGAHRVTFEFRPRSVEIGALASLAGLTLLAAVLVVPRLRRHAEPVQSMLATTTRSA
ncbi:MAG: hypothetical protein QOD06_3062, partial [Candidatus Binatota bacterium]|nr:hypothetical protein [Candidatus Binatota bacterium]